MSDLDPKKIEQPTKPKILHGNTPHPRFTNPKALDIVPVNCPFTVTLDLDESDTSLTHRVLIADTSGWAFNWGDFGPGVTTHNFTIDPIYGDQPLVMTVNVAEDVNPVPDQSPHVIRVTAATEFMPEATSDHGSGPIHIVEGETVTFYVTLYGGIPPYDYEVRVNGAKICYGVGVPAGSYSCPHPFNTAGSYTVSFIASDKSGCQPQYPIEDIDVWVYEAPEEPEEPDGP